MTDERFEQFVANVVADQNGCWRWTGSINNKGYGRMSVGKWRMAHRLAYEHFIGPIQDDYELDHLCRSAGCVNPTHVEPVTHGENLRRGLRCKASAVWAGTSAEYRAKLSRALTGIKRSAETNAKNSAASRGRWLGRTHTAETRAKMAVAQLARWQRKREGAA
jgi:hypothetical protein